METGWMTPLTIAHGQQEPLPLTGTAAPTGTAMGLPTSTTDGQSTTRISKMNTRLPQTPITTALTIPLTVNTLSRAQKTGLSDCGTQPLTSTFVLLTQCQMARSPRFPIRLMANTSQRVSMMTPWTSITQATSPPFMEPSASMLGVVIRSTASSFLQTAAL